LSEKLANPAPLGLMGFGMTTVLLNLHNSGFYPLDTMILSMGLTYGGLAQIIAGIMEFKKGNTFGTTAFCSYGLFWLSLVALHAQTLSESFLNVEIFSKTSMAAYFFMWGLFTAIMFIGTLKANRALQFVFLSLAILFFLLTARDLTNISFIGTVAGYEGVLCGLSAVYLALAEVLNEIHGKTILPIGVVSE
jgi:succinate-acetate transporter protein